MTVRRATVEDLPKLSACAEEFYAASKFLRKFDLSRFVAMWSSLLNSDTGVIFLLVDGDMITGMIGAMVYPEAYSDEIILQEFFLFIRKEHRGGFGLLRLYRALEEYAVERNCTQIRMGHLQDSQPDGLRRLYLRLGFEHMETSYAKVLTV